MRWLFLIGLMGCPRAVPVTYDPSLPEETEEVSSSTAEEVLKAEAGQLDPALRALALGLVVQADWGPEWDARALGDPSPWVQRAAVEALLLRGGADAASRLEAFVADKNRDPMARALAAIRAPSETMASAVSQAWPRESAPWRRAPLALAALVNGDGAARGSLSRDLALGELPFDVDLFFEIGRTGEGALVLPLREAQKAVESELRLPVAAARWMLGDGTAEEPFRKAVSGSDIERRLEALDYLVRLDRDQVRGLLAKARNQGPELVTWYAELALAAGTGTDSGLFERAAEDGDREVRELAVRFAAQAARGGSPNRRVVKAAEKVVVRALEDRDDRVRMEALKAVRELGFVASIEQVELLLGHENRRVRLEAAGTLLSLGG